MMRPDMRLVFALAVAPTVTPRKMTTMLFISFCEVLLRRSTTPLSRKRLPSISMPTSGAAEGNRRLTMIVTAMGKMIFSRLLTGRS